MIISPFNPLFFLGERKSYGVQSPFTQFFSPNDRIFIEVIRTSVETPYECTLHDIGGNIDSPVSVNSHVLDDDTVVDCYEIDNLATGCYVLSLGNNISEPFKVISDERIIEKSVLIEYALVNNNVRTDVVSVIDGEKKYFSMRFPGGFKDSGLEFSVDNEQFVTQGADIIELYSMESTQRTLTVGWSEGVPIWFGQLLNRILTCRYVYIDGQRYARYESSVPEKAQTLEGVNSFVFTQKLQRINHLEPVKINENEL